MVKFLIEVELDPKKAVAGSRKVRGALKETETAADRLRKTVRNVFVGLGVTLVIRELGRVADAYTNVQNRVRTVTSGQEELTRVTRQLFEIATATRSAFDATAEVYTRTALAVKDLGISQEETLNFTKSLNQAVILSGAAAQEARAGLIQLSQGLASNRLSGDELRSVLEQLPVVADVISKSLGITRGELRGMGQDGKITADVILKAFREARVELDERFGKSVPTLAQSFVVLKNNIVEFVGTADTAIGASSGLAAIILFGAENVDILAAGLTVLSLGIAVTYIPATVTATGVTVAFGGALKSVSALLLANPFGLAVVGIAAAAFAVNALKLEFLEIKTEIDKATAAGEKFALSDFGKVGVDINRANAQLERFNELAAQDIAAQGFIDPGLERAIENVTEKIARLSSEQGRLADGTAQTVSEARKQSAAIVDVAKAVDATILSIKVENKLLGKNVRERRIQIEVLREIARIERTRGEGSVTDLQRQELEATLRLNDELTRRAGVLERVKGPEAEFKADLAQLKILLDQDIISLKEFNIESANLTQGFEGLDLDALGIGELSDLQRDLNERLRAGTIGVAEYAAELRKAAEAAALLAQKQDEADKATKKLANEMTRSEAILNDALASGFRNAEDALVSFVRTGEIDFKAFVDSLLDDIARLLVRQAILAAFGGGGLPAGQASNITGFAHGGEFKKGQTFIAGEEGPEIITSQTDGQVIPAGETAAIMQGGAQAPEIIVTAPPATVQVINVSDPNEIPLALESEAGTQAIMNVLGKEKQTVRNLVS